MKNNIFKEVRATLIILSMISLVGIFVNYANMESYITIMYSLIIYVVFTTIVHFLTSNFKSKTLTKINFYLGFPIAFLYGLLLVTIPYLTIIIQLIFYVSIVTIIPHLIFKLLNYYELIESLKTLTIDYLEITATVIFSVLFNSSLRRLVSTFSISKLQKSDHNKALELDRLTDYTLSRNNIRFLIYSGYAIYLLISNYQFFQSSDTNSINNSTSLILQSFATFLAFDTAFYFLKNVEFKPSKLLTKINFSIFNELSGQKKTDAKVKEVDN